MAHLQLNNILRDKALAVAGPRFTYGGGTYTPRAQQRIDELLHEGALRGPSGIQWGLGSTFGGSDSDEDYDSDVSDGELMGGNKNNKEAARRNKWIKWLRKTGLDPRKPATVKKYRSYLRKMKAAAKKRRIAYAKKKKKEAAAAKKKAAARKKTPPKKKRKSKKKKQAPKKTPTKKKTEVQKKRDFLVKREKDFDVLINRIHAFAEKNGFTYNSVVQFLKRRFRREEMGVVELSEESSDEGSSRGMSSKQKEKYREAVEAASRLGAIRQMRMEEEEIMREGKKREVMSEGKKRMEKIRAEERNRELLLIEEGLRAEKKRMEIAFNAEEARMARARQEEEDADVIMARRILETEEDVQDYIKHREKGKEHVGTGYFGGIGPSLKSKHAANRNKWIRFLLASGGKANDVSVQKKYWDLKRDGKLDSYLNLHEGSARASRSARQKIDRARKQQDWERYERVTPEKFRGKELEKLVKLETMIIKWAERHHMPYGAVLKYISSKKNYIHKRTQLLWEGWR